MNKQKLSWGFRSMVTIHTCTFYTGNIYIDLKMFVIFIFGVSHSDTSNSFSWLHLFSSITYYKPIESSSPYYSWWYKNWIYGLYILARSSCGSLGIWAESNCYLVKVGPSFRIRVISFSLNLPKSHLKTVIELCTVIFQYLFCKILESEKKVNKWSKPSE